jgi:hypothetical protein
MFKQIFIAIIIGSFLGLSLTSLYFNYKNKNHNPKFSNENTTIEEEIIIKEKTDESKIKETNEQKNISTIFLDIFTPENESIVGDDTLSISGKTNPDSTIIINTLNETFHTISKESGEFDIDINLDAGINILHFTSISADNSQIEKEILVTYSTAKI